MIDKLYKKLFLVNLLLRLTVTATTIISTFLIARFLGSDKMAAYGICGPFFTIGCFVGYTFTNGASFIITKLLGTGKREEANKVFNTTLFVLLAVSVLLSIICIIFAEGIVVLLGANGESAYLVPEAAKALRGLFIGFPFYTLYLFVVPMIVLDGGIKRTQIASISNTLFTCVLLVINLILLKLDLIGAGLACSLNYLLPLGIILPKFFVKNSLFTISIKGLDLKNVKPILGSGFASGISFLFYSVVQILANLYANKIAGPDGLAASAIAYNAWPLICSFVTATAISSSTLASLFYGERDKQGIKHVYIKAFKFSLYFQVPFTILLLIFTKQFALIYLDNPSVELLKLSMFITRGAAIGGLFAIIQCSTINYLQAVDKPFYSFLFTVIYFISDGIFGRILVCSAFGRTGLFLCWILGQIGVILAWYIITQIKAKTFKHPITNYSLLPLNFEASVEDAFHKSIYTIEEAVEFSNFINEACKKHNIESGRAYKLCLCIEEMLVNIIEHGLTKDNKDHLIEARVVFEHEDIILRIRDDCVKFNIKDKCKTMEIDPNNPEKNMGIRMVLAVAKDVRYTYTLNTNNLIITL